MWQIFSTNAKCLHSERKPVCCLLSKNVLYLSIDKYEFQRWWCTMIKDNTTNSQLSSHVFSSDEIKDAVSTVLRFHREIQSKDVSIERKDRIADVFNYFANMNNKNDENIFYNSNQKFIMAEKGSFEKIKNHEKIDANFLDKAFKSMDVFRALEKEDIYNYSFLNSNFIVFNCFGVARAKHVARDVMNMEISFETVEDVEKNLEYFPSISRDERVFSIDGFWNEVASQTGTETIGMVDDNDDFFKTLNRKKFSANINEIEQYMHNNMKDLYVRNNEDERIDFYCSTVAEMLSNFKTEVPSTECQKFWIDFWKNELQFSKNEERFETFYISSIKWRRNTQRTGWSPPENIGVHIFRTNMENLFSNGSIMENIVEQVEKKYPEQTVKFDSNLWNYFKVSYGFLSYMIKTNLIESFVSVVNYVYNNTVADIMNEFHKDCSKFSEEDRKILQKEWNTGLYPMKMDNKFTVDMLMHDDVRQIMAFASYYNYLDEKNNSVIPALALDFEISSTITNSTIDCVCESDYEKITKASKSWFGRAFLSGDVYINSYKSISFTEIVELFSTLLNEFEEYIKTNTMVPEKANLEILEILEKASYIEVESMS